MVNMEQLRSAAERLVDTDDAINACPDCFPDAYCFKHAEQWGEAMYQLRLAIGKPPNTQAPKEFEG